jgi:superfamily II DNA/RNA helicase
MNNPPQVPSESHGIEDLTDAYEACIDEAVQHLNSDLVAKDFQKNALRSILLNHITIVAARTGAGKSLIYHALPVIYEILKTKKLPFEQIAPGSNSSGSKNPKNSILLIVPFISIAGDVTTQTREKYPNLVCRF